VPPRSDGRVRDARAPAGSASPVADARKPEPGNQPALHSASIHDERSSIARAHRGRVVVVARAFTDVLQGRSCTGWSIEACARCRGSRRSGGFSELADDECRIAGQRQRSPGRHPPLHSGRAVDDICGLTASLHSISRPEIASRACGSGRGSTRSSPGAPRRGSEGCRTASRGLSLKLMTFQ